MTPNERESFGSPVCFGTGKDLLFPFPPISTPSWRPLRLCERLSLVVLRASAPLPDTILLLSPARYHSLKPQRSQREDKNNHKNAVKKGKPARR